MSDYKNNIERFFKGELNVGDFKPDNKKDSDTDFIDVYKKVIDESRNEQTPDFNPFEKIVSSDRKKQVNIIKRLLPYAAILLILVGTFSIFKYLKYQQKAENNKYSEQQITEIKENTEYALLYFSKELNNSLKNLETAKHISQPFDELQKLKDIKIEFDNPIKNLKFN